MGANANQARTRGANQEFDNSLNDFIDRVRSAFNRQFSRASDYIANSEYVWATDVFSDYVIAKQGDKYYRVGTEVTDDAITFDARADWQQVKLSYVAEMLGFERRRDVMLVYEIKGKYPDVPFADGVDVEELTAGDDNPVFVTLPIGKANVRSGNKRFYDEAFVQELERQVIANKPIGLMGHLTPSQRATEFPQEAVHWLGALRVGELLWGKGYLPPGEARDRLKRYKSTGKKIATSIDADLEGEWDDSVASYRMKAKTLKLAQIDIAPADRAGIADLAAVPHLTSEMLSLGENSSEQKNAAHDGGEGEDEMDRSQVIREMTAEDAKILPEPVRAAVLESAPVAAEVKLVQELRQTLGLDDKADLKGVVTAMHTKQGELTKAAIKAHIVEMATPDPKRPADEDLSIKQEPLRALVIEMVEAKTPASVEEAETAYKAVIASEPVKQLLASRVVREMGPAQGVAVAGQASQAGKYFRIPQENKESASWQ